MKQRTGTNSEPWFTAVCDFVVTITTGSLFFGDNNYLEGTLPSALTTLAFISLDGNCLADCSYARRASGVCSGVCNASLPLIPQPVSTPVVIEVRRRGV